MGKQIPIDDLFREKLSEGEEQLNLGAWANMERMLDGKNPYADEEKRKRRILPFILLFTLLSGVVTAGYVALTKSHNKSANVQIETASVEPKRLETASHTTPVSKTITDQNSKTDLTPTDSKSKNIGHKKAAESKKTLAQNESNNVNVESSSLNQTSQKEIATSHPSTTQKIRKNKTQKNKAISQSIDQNNNLVAHQTTTNPSSKASTAEGDGTNESIGKSATNQTINQYDLQQKVEMDRTGNPLVGLDTVSSTQYSLENESQSIASNSTLTPEETNPRLVSLTPEQELAINSPTPKLQAEKSISSAPLIASTNEVPSPKRPELKQHKTEDESFFSKFRNFAAVNIQKMSLLTTSLINMGYPMIPGISVGVNAAIFNPKNNFGGFHLGVNNLKPLNERFSILSEFIYFIRNNSGYTIDDITTLNKNISADNVTLASQNKTIYNYQVDSTVSNYNFKNFSSLELPVKLQAHFRSFTAYGGLNMAYIFKLNVKENKKNYVLNKEEILDNSVSFYPKEELLKRYSRDDFSSRFGLGYTIGTSVSLSPNLYIDARLTQNVWDNAKSVAAKEVSSGYFKVPTVQLSLGYRFKKFTPND